MTLGRHGRACPGHLDTQCKDYRDARNKCGHDGAVLFNVEQEIAR
jgi:hypothetical protein